MIKRSMGRHQNKNAAFTTLLDYSVCSKERDEDLPPFSWPEAVTHESLGLTEAMNKSKRYFFSQNWAGNSVALRSASIEVPAACCSINQKET